MRCWITASVVAVMSIGLFAMPAEAGVKDSAARKGSADKISLVALAKCGPAPAATTAQYKHAKRAWVRRVRKTQQAERAKRARMLCGSSARKANRANERAAALAGKPGVKAAWKRATLAERGAKRLCALADMERPQPSKAAPGEGFVAPPPQVRVVRTKPPVPAPVVPAAPVRNAATAGWHATASNSGTAAARASGSAPAVSAPRTGRLRSITAVRKLPILISSRDSRIRDRLIPAVARKATFPLFLMIVLLIGFLFVQRWIDRDDPKLAGASSPDRDLTFE